MEPPERAVAPPEVPPDADVSQSAGKTSIMQETDKSRSCAAQDQRQPRLEKDGWDLQQLWGHSVQPEFQDSNLSPGLALLPASNAMEHMFTEYSLFQQSDNEFVPLRPCADISVASEKFHFHTPQDCTSQVSEHDSLSQHPLIHTTVLSEPEVSSCCPLSLYSLSPEDKGRQKETSHSSLILSSNGKEVPLRNNTEPNPQDHPVDEAAEYEAFFLTKEIPSEHHLELLQKDLGILSGSSSIVSSETSVNIVKLFSEESENPQACKLGIEQSTVGQESVSDEVFRSQQQKQQTDRHSYPDKSQTLLSESSNITTGPRNTQPDESSEVLHRELLNEIEQRSSYKPESKTQQKSPTIPGLSLTPHPTELSKEQLSVTRTNLDGGSWTRPFSVGVERGHRQQDHWSIGNQTGIDGSYLGFLPQSQSTPGVFKAPPKSDVKAKVKRLSAIESNTEDSSQSGTGISLQSRDQEEAASSKVQSLPSLSYMQKVNAWRANQTSEKTSLFDSLALQGFSGISPKKKAYDAVSDTLNRILSQQARSSQPPPVLNTANQNVTKSSSEVPSGSSLRRGENVGSTPSETENSVPAERPSTSFFGRSQSHSSLSTVMSVKKDQQTEKCTEEKNQPHDDVHREQNTSAQLLSLVNLGQFSDMVAQQDLTHSLSQDSHSSGIKLGTSVGTSSAISLEVDNYAPYWTSKPSTPPPQPRSQEVNIEERIPLYLRNLGIDQSPSTILTPFIPRGPIREPEFSPTDLCTIKGSIGTPTKSTQPSAGDSPQKGEFSRSSIMSLASSISIPFSLDSLGPAASVPEQTKQASPSSDTEDVQCERRVLTYSQPDEVSHPSTLQSNLQQQRDSSLTSSQNTVQLGDKLDSDLSSATEAAVSEARIQTSMEEYTQSSLVSSKALLEICKLLTQAVKVASPGSSVVSPATPSAPRLLSDENIFLSLQKKTKLQDNSFFSSSVPEDSRCQSSWLWKRSSSDPMLTSENLRKITVERENMTTSGQPNYPPFITASATASYIRPQDTAGSRGAGSSVVVPQSVQRAEPEGCSAASPVQPQPAVISQPSTTQQLTSTLIVMTAATEEGKQVEGPLQSSSSSSPLPEDDTDQRVMSDESSENSLAGRVAKLLQSESPDMVEPSTPSMTDPESNDRELTVSGQQGKPLELHEEDRRQIEEIKKELLLRNPKKYQGSTDTESSTASSIRLLRGEDPAQQAEAFATIRDGNSRRQQPLQDNSTDFPISSVQLQKSSCPDLEAQIHKIAAREGVTLPRAFTSITIACRRRSTSPTPPPSPAHHISPAPQLHLTMLSKQTHDHTPAMQPPSTPVEEHKTTTEPAAVCELSSSLYLGNQTLTSQLEPEEQKRQDAVGMQVEEPALPPMALGRQQDNNTQYFRGNGELAVQYPSISGPEQVTASSTSESAGRSGHVSHVHLTLSPKATNHGLDTAVHSSLIDGVMEVPPEEIVLSSAASSLDAGVGSSSPQEWYDNRELIRQRVDTTTLYKTTVPHRRMTSQSFTSNHRAVVLPRSQTTESPATPILLPYKPRGSEELFYIPQTEADISSDTTMESSHTGSDDAVPPRFSSEVLGCRDPGWDRGVTIRHTEGIYSKRFKSSAFKMQEPGSRDETSQTNVSGDPKTPSVVFSQRPLLRDQGTSPVHFRSYDPPETSPERFQPVHIDVDYENVSHHLERTSVSQVRDQDLDLPHTAAQQNSSLDQLWERFCACRSLEESRPTSHREASLLERLERLSRLIHSTRGTKVPETYRVPQEEVGRRQEDVTGTGRKNSQVGEMEGRVRRRREVEEPHFSHQAWTHRVQEPSQPADEGSFTSSCSHDTFQHQHPRPADRDESETLSTASGSISTVDTARLVRVYGAHRVEHLKNSASLRKLYSTIDKQKEGREQRRGRTKEPVHITPAETTDESTITADSALSTSSYILLPHHGPSRALTAKKAVKLVSKGIQAGDLELVCDGTRRHTRDVGTTFPSPAVGRTSGQISSSSSSTNRGRSWRSTSKTQKQRRSKRSPSKNRPEGVSWFISADELRSEARKENRPDKNKPTWRPSTSWFEPCSRIKPWREPLRQRQVPEDGNRQASFTHHSHPGVERRTKPGSSGLTRLSLQEALEMRCPEFIARSKQRLNRLALRSKERKLQEVFSRQREKVFLQPRGPGRSLRPAGTSVLRTAVPWKEMIQRSKQMYDNLPEVQRRREEERRKAEYQSYRLNAQIYNKKITKHILGRRRAWQ